MSRKVYEVDVERDGKFWLIHVPAVDRSTQARNLQELDTMARDLVAIMTDSTPESFDLDIVVKVSPKAVEHLERANVLRKQSIEANAQAAMELRAGVLAMSEDGFTVRDIGRLMGISHQRVHQLLHPDAALVAKSPLAPHRFYGGGQVQAGEVATPRLVAAG